MIDVVLLRIMRHRADYYKLIGVVPKGPPLDARTVAIIEDFGKYFERYPTHPDVDLVTFLPRFKAWHPGMTEDVFNTFVATLRGTLREADDDQKRNIVSELGELQLVTKLGNLVSQHTEGDLEADILQEITSALDSHRSLLGLRHKTWIDDPIGDLLQDEFQDTGVSWRLGCLNRCMRKLRPGDFGIVAGRPDKGKTSFIASEVTHFASQLPSDKNVLWLNNEGPGKRIIPRLYQAALNLTLTEMKELHANGKLVDMYRESVGRLDRIRVVDIHSMTNGQVETIIEDHSPGVIVYDMIDNIRGFGDEARTDLALERMYQWGRERSVKYECIGIATSQISNDGDGMQFPTLGMLKDSKTGKQGACDFQLMLGASNDPALQGSRFIGLPKNKLRREGSPGDPREEVVFDGQRSRYRDIEELGV